MNVLDEVKKRPIVSSLTLVGAAGAVILFMNVMPGLELIVRIKKAPDVADAALQKATESREWIDEYIQQQKQQQALEQQRYELEQEFKKKLFEMQGQQHMPQQAPNQKHRLESPRIRWEQDEDGDWYCTDGRQSWWPSEEGYCE